MLIELIRTVTVILAIVLVYICIRSLYKKVYLDNKYRLSEDFHGCIDILLTIIQYEIEAFEKDVFTNREGITNRNFETMYADLTKKICNRISDNLINNLTVYISFDYIYLIVARKVKEYLLTKIPS